MTGAQMALYLSRRLAEEGLTIEANRQNELYDYLTEGRDEVKTNMALAAPLAVGEFITLLQVDPVLTPEIWKLPDATRDPLRVWLVRDPDTHEEFTPSTGIDQDGGDYEWITPRQLRLAQSTDADKGIEIFAVIHGADITVATTELQVGIPTPMHRAACKYAAVLALTADEESDAQNAIGLFGKEMEKLERLYSEFDAMGGAGLRSALMKSAGAQFGEHLY